MTATEIERLVVRITADGSMFFSTMNRVERKVQQSARAVQQSLRAIERAQRQSAAAAERAQQRSSRAAEQAARAKERAAQREIAALNRASFAAHRAMEQRERQAARHFANLQRMQERAFADMEAAGRRLSLLVTAPLVLGGRGATRQFSDFDRSITEAFARLGGGSAEQRALAERTILGLSTSGRTAFGAAELAGGFQDLAAAGLGVEAALQALPRAAAFAQAGVMDVSEATEHLLGAMTALGLATDEMGRELSPEEFQANMTRVSDAVTTVANKSLATVRGLSISLTTDSAASARLLGMEVEELVVLLGAYAEAGKHAEVAGHMLGRGVRLLTNAFVRNREAWDALNIDLTDGTGNWVEFTDQVDRLARGLEGFGTVDVTAILSSLGIATLSQKAILPLLDQIEWIRKVRRLTQGDPGSTANTAKLQMDSFANQIAVLQNRIAAAAIEVGRSLAPAVSWLLGLIASLADWFRRLDPTTRAVIVTLAALTAAAGPLLVVLGMFGGVYMRLAQGAAQAAVAVARLTLAMIEGTTAGRLFGASLIVLATVGLAKAIGEIVAQVSGLNAALREAGQLTQQLARLTEAGGDEDLAAIRRIANPEQRRAALTERIGRERREITALEARAIQDEERFRRPDPGPINRFLGLSLETSARGVGLTGSGYARAIADMLYGAQRSFYPALSDADRAPLDQTEAMLNARRATLEKLQRALQLMGRPRRNVHRSFMSIEEEAEFEGDIQSLTESLQEQAAVLGLTAERARIYALAVRGATEEELQAARAAADLIERHERLTKLREEGARVTEETRTPEEAYIDRAARLRELHNEGVITQVVYNRALAQAGEQFREDTAAADQLKQAVDRLAQVQDHAAFGSAEARSRMAAQRAMLTSVAALTGGSRALPDVPPEALSAVADRIARRAVDARPDILPRANRERLRRGEGVPFGWVANSVAGPEGVQLLGEAVAYLRQMAQGQPIQFVPAGGP